MRAVVQGVDVAAAWDRYLRIEGESSDGRAVRSTIAWIRDAFSSAAQQHARFGVARLVRLDTARLNVAGERVPTLEVFAADQGLEDFSEAEQLEAYEAEYRHVLRRARRRQRLIERQLEALNWLESFASQPYRARRAAAQAPRAEDAVQAWINPLLAGHLQRAELLTLGALVERINGIGRRWYVPIRGLGSSKAERIVTWLRDHEPSLVASGASPLLAHVDRPRSALTRADLASVQPPASDIRPLEKLVIPAELDGSRGTHRRPQQECLLDADTDRLAILAWLRSKAPATVPREPPREQGRAAMQPARREVSPAAAEPAVELDLLGTLSHTQRSYRKEAERLLLWAVVERGKPLSSLSAEDCSAYRDFIADPQPRDRWCAPRARERWSPLWRPFEGPLSAAAQRLTLRILGNLFNYLAQQNYLAGNPWTGAHAATPARPVMDPGRSFTASQWRFIVHQAAELQPTQLNLRLKLALELLYATGLRLSEAVAATVDDLEWVAYAPSTGPAHNRDGPELEGGWMLRVVGKGQKLREVAMPPTLVDELSHALLARGLNADLQGAENRGAHLLGQVDEGRAVNRRGRAPSRSASAATVELNPKAGIAATTLYAQLKRFFVQCAAARERSGDAAGAERFRRASTHWLRHTHATHALAAGVPVDVARQNLGHASLATTSVYVQCERERQLRAMEAMWTSAGG